jgi:hypothetical protein
MTTFSFCGSGAAGPARNLQSLKTLQILSSDFEQFASPLNSLRILHGRLDDSVVDPVEPLHVTSQNNCYEQYISGVQRAEIGRVSEPVVEVFELYAPVWHYGVFNAATR